MEHVAMQVAQSRYGRVMDIAVAPLFCALTLRTVWNEIGGLDESFEIGMFEDDDFALRVRQSGRRMVTAEDCFVHHFGQGSFKKLPRREYEELFDRNRRRFESKWKVTWKPHRYREGVSAPPVALRPEDFVR
jgi:GT2 family glycosyltransferase